MDHQFNGGSWMMIPNQNPLNQDFHSLQPQYQPPPPLPQQLQQQHHHHPSLASHFHLLPTVEGQKRKLEETVQQLNQRDLVVKYRSQVEELVNPENNR